MSAIRNVVGAVTAPFRLVAEIVSLPRRFRRRLFEKGRGSDTGNVSPAPS